MLGLIFRLVSVNAVGIYPELKLLWLNVAALLLAREAVILVTHHLTLRLVLNAVITEDLGHFEVCPGVGRAQGWLSIGSVPARHLSGLGLAKSGF